MNISIDYALEAIDDFQKDFINEPELISLSKKEFFVKKNRICKYIGVVEQGSLFSYINDKHIEKRINGIYISQSIVTSYRSFLTQTPSVGHIQAYSNSVIRVISYEKYLKLQEDKRWLKFFKTIGDELFISKCEKETSLIIHSAKERYTQLIENIPFIEQFFPQHILASYLNIRPETLSRLKSLDLHQH